MGTRPHSAPGKRGEGPWAPRLLEAAVPAEDSAPLLQEPPAHPRLRDEEKLRGREPRSLGCAPHPAPRSAAATATATGPSCMPWLPRAVQGYPRGFRTAAQLALSKNKKTKDRQILWSSFLTRPHRCLFLSFFLYTIGWEGVGEFFLLLLLLVWGGFFALMPHSQNISPQMPHIVLHAADRLLQVASYR